MCEKEINTWSTTAAVKKQLLMIRFMLLAQLILLLILVLLRIQDAGPSAYAYASASATDSVCGYASGSDFVATYAAASDLGQSEVMGRVIVKVMVISFVVFLQPHEQR